MCFFVIKIQVISFEVWSLKKAKKKIYLAQMQLRESIFTQHIYLYKLQTYV